MTADDAAILAFLPVEKAPHFVGVSFIFSDLGPKTKWDVVSVCSTFAERLRSGRARLFRTQGACPGRAGLGQRSRPRPSEIADFQPLCSDECGERPRQASHACGGQLSRSTGREWRCVCQAFWPGTACCAPRKARTAPAFTLFYSVVKELSTPASRAASRVAPGPRQRRVLLLLSFRQYWFGLFSRPCNLRTRNRMPPRRRSN